MGGWDEMSLHATTTDDDDDVFFRSSRAERRIHGFPPQPGNVSALTVRRAPSHLPRIGNITADGDRQPISCGTGQGAARDKARWTRPSRWWPTR